MTIALSQLWQNAADRLGFSEFDGTLVSLSADRLEKLYDEMADQVLASPSSYAQIIQDWASKRRGGANYGQDLESYSFLDKIDDFVGEAGNQAVSINDNLNPFSGKNRRFVWWLLVGSAVVYFLAPPIIASLKKAKE